VPPSVNLSALVPRGVVVPCGPGFGLAASAALGVVATSSTRTHTVTLWDLHPDGTLSARGPVGRFARTAFAFGDTGGGLCFTDPEDGSAPTLLVADTLNNRVVEVGLQGGPGALTPFPRSAAVRAPVTPLGSLPNLPSPSAVAASRALIGVCVSRGGSWKVVLLNATTRVPVSTVRLPRMCVPRGLRMSVGGTTVVVADPARSQVSLLRVIPDSDLLTTHSGGAVAYDVEEVVGGWLAPCHLAGQVVFLPDGRGVRPSGSQPSGGVLGDLGSGPGQFEAPVALALAPGLGLVVRESGNGGRFQVFR
jgi:hypothetical protein